MQHIRFAKPKQRLLWQILILGVLAVGLMALAACGGTSSPSGSTTASPSGGTVGGAVSSAAQGAKEAVQGAKEAVQGAGGGAVSSAAQKAKEAVGAGGGTTVNMTDSLTFDPANVTINKGGTVTWKNTSSVVHTATDDPSKAATAADASLPAGAQPWNSGDVQPNGSWSHTFDTAGTYKYFCIPHESAGMVGTITVK